VHGHLRVIGARLHAQISAGPEGHEIVAHAVFADDFQTIRVFAERDNTNIVHWSRFDRGGHYAALEVPEVVAGDIRAFFAER